MKVLNSLAEALDMNPLDISVDAQLPVATPAPESVNPDAEQDIEVARESLKNSLAKGKDALEGVLVLAKGSEDAKAYTAVAAIMKAISDTNKELVTVHKTKKEIMTPGLDNLLANDGSQEALPAPQAQKVTNVFVGTTADLLKMAKAQNKAAKEAADGIKEAIDVTPTGPSEEE